MILTVLLSLVYLEKWDQYKLRYEFLNQYNYTDLTPCFDIFIQE